MALIAGHTLLGTGFAANARPLEVATARGSVTLLDADTFVYLQRHGTEEYRAPHAIDSGAHLLALVEAGCERVLAMGTVGSLRAEIAVGSFVAPDDFIALTHRATLFDDARGHLVPGFDLEWRRTVVEAFAAAGEPPRDGGVYWEAEGPRFETPAEARLMAASAEVAGMTIASEAVIAREVGLRYAAVCTVDNFVNGIAPQPLTPEEYEKGRSASRERAQKALAQVVPALAGNGTAR